MGPLRDLCYVRVGTSDLAGAVAFATSALGLRLVGRERGAAYLRGGDAGDHTLAYVEGDKAAHAVGLTLQEPSDVDAVGAILDAAGRPVRHGTRRECDERRVVAFVATNDLSGNAIEIVAAQGRAGRDDRGVGLSSVGLGARDAARDEAFWTKSFGLRVADWIGDAAMLRLGTRHHALALYPSARRGLRYVDHAVRDVDHILRAWHCLRERGVRILFGPGRHPFSGAVFLYVAGPDGMVYALTSGARHVPAGGIWRPRQFPWAPESFCLWGSRADPAMFEPAMLTRAA